MSETPSKLKRARRLWRYTGKGRPEFAVMPGPGQESVWDYPRPPRIEPDARRVQVSCAGVTLADTTRCLRVLETASPPTFYLPMEDVRMEYLHPCTGSSLCEWKGCARYWSVYLRDSFIAERAAWSYPVPYDDSKSIAGYVSFYPAKVDCCVAGVRVTAQPGGFYGGWVTPEIVGPFKGLPGTQHW